MVTQDVEADIVYSKDVVGRARFNFSDLADSNLAFEPARKTIRDVRPVRDEFSLANAGFSFVKHRSDAMHDPRLIEKNMASDEDHGPAVAKYHQELGDYLLAQTGAREFIPQFRGFVLRTSRRAAAKSWAPPASFAHMDFTAKSANQFLEWSAQAAGLEVKPYSHLKIVQAWRAISPGPQDNVLCVCDGRTVEPFEAVVFDSVLPRGGMASQFESRMCRFNEKHQWYYLPNMEEDDVILFTGFDDEAPDSMTGMHSGFDNPFAGPDSPARVSIESRYLLLFD